MVQVFVEGLREATIVHVPAKVDRPATEVHSVDVWQKVKVSIEVFAADRIVRRLSATFFSRIR